MCEETENILFISNQTNGHDLVKLVGIFLDIFKVADKIMVKSIVKDKLSCCISQFCADGIFIRC